MPEHDEAQLFKYFELNMFKLRCNFNILEIFTNKQYWTKFDTKVDFQRNLVVCFNIASIYEYEFRI